jgi:alkanesulfonate monooxygenase SsuD/methylene tetrahydromethanopterin reductase-like flavin-dependent oxidoreductase (luciferase family)
MPGGISAPAVRRVAELCDAWHPLGLSLNDLEKGIGMIRDLAEKAGRCDAVHFAPRNLLHLTPSTKGSERAAFEGSPAEIAADIQRAQALGCDYLTFDLPNVDVPEMVRTMERFVREVKPAAS